MPFSPFANQTQSLSIDNLTLENHLEHISMYGNINISKDKIGLANAQALQLVFAQMVEVLQQENNLPERISIRKTKQINNPFR